MPEGLLNFSNVFSDEMVLQMEPASAAVYGYFSGTSPAAKVTVTVSSGTHESYSVDATVDSTKGTWKAFLKPTAAGGSYRIVAACASGCSGQATIEDITFGSVWYCAGQVSGLARR